MAEPEGVDVDASGSPEPLLLFLHHQWLGLATLYVGQMASATAPESFACMLWESLFPSKHTRTIRTLPQVGKCRREIRFCVGVLVTEY
jgi:hypothetical protein